MMPSSLDPQGYPQNLVVNFHVKKMSNWGYLECLKS